MEGTGYLHAQGALPWYPLSRKLGASRHMSQEGARCWEPVKWILERFWTALVLLWGQTSVLSRAMPQDWRSMGVMLTIRLNLVPIIKEYGGCTSTRMPSVTMGCSCCHEMWSGRGGGGVKAVNTIITVFWDVTPCSFVDGCLHCYIPEYRDLHFMTCSAVILLILSC